MKLPTVVYLGSLPINLYWGFIFLTLAVCIIYNVWAAQMYGFKVWKVIICTLLFFGYNWGMSYLLTGIEEGFEKVAANGVRAWIYVPFFFLVCSLIIKDKKARVMDMMAPCLVLGIGMGHFGCMFPGCCHGYHYEGPLKLWSNTANDWTFPIQLVECVVATAIFVVLVVIMVKNKFKTTGRQYPLLLIMFGLTRFVIEFWRDNEKIVGNVSSLAIHALFGAVVGIVWLILTTAQGRIFCIKLTNWLKKLFKSKIPLKEVITVEEMKERMKQEKEASIIKPQKVATVESSNN